MVAEMVAEMVTEMGGAAGEEEGEGSRSGQMGGDGEVGGNGGMGGAGETDRVGETDGAGKVRAMGGLGGSGARTSLALASGARPPAESRGGDEAAEAAEAAESTDAAESAEAAEAAELRSALARLRLRETRLCGRLEARRSAARGSPFLARLPNLPAAGVGPSGGVRRGPFARRRIWPGERNAKSVHPAAPPPQDVSPSCSAGLSSRSTAAESTVAIDSLLVC